MLYYEYVEWTLMYTLIAQFLIFPLSAFFAQVGGTPNNIGMIILIVITLVLLGGSTFYFIEHKKKTMPPVEIGREGEHAHS